MKQSDAACNKYACNEVSLYDFQQTKLLKLPKARLGVLAPLCLGARPRFIGLELTMELSSSMRKTALHKLGIIESSIQFQNWRSKCVYMFVARSQQ